MLDVVRVLGVGRESVERDDVLGVEAAIGGLASRELVGVLVLAELDDVGDRAEFTIRQISSLGAGLRLQLNVQERSYLRSRWLSSIRPSSSRKKGGVKP